MVYYLRPHPRESSYSLGHKLTPTGSPVPPAPVQLTASKSLSLSQVGVEDTHLTAYLVLGVIVAAVTAAVVTLGVKPNENCAAFLTTKNDDGTVTVSPLKVTGLSLGVGAVVAVVAYLVHSFNPSLLQL